MKKNFLILLLMISFCSCGKYCISTNVEKYGVTGEICYDSTQSELEGNIVFIDSNGKKIVGIDENDIKDIISIIESGKKLWDYGKDLFGLSISQYHSQRLHSIIKKYREYKVQEYKNLKKD